MAAVGNTTRRAILRAIPAISTVAMLPLVSEQASAAPSKELEFLVAKYREFKALSANTPDEIDIDPEMGQWIDVHYEILERPCASVDDVRLKLSIMAECLADQDMSVDEDDFLKLIRSFGSAI